MVNPDKDVTDIDRVIRNELRKLAYELLDDEHGINEDAFCTLCNLLEYVGIEDAIAHDTIDASEGRFYIVNH